MTRVSLFSLEGRKCDIMQPVFVRRAGGMKNVTCFLGRSLDSSSNCSTSWASGGSGLFTQQTVEEASQHSFISSPCCRTIKHTSLSTMHQEVTAKPILHGKHNKSSYINLIYIVK